MSLSSALSNSASGLNAAARGMQTVSDNVANALTPGYVRRSPDVASRAGGGVAIGADLRQDAQRLSAERRQADASIGSAQAKATALDRVATAYGIPGTEDTLSAMLAKLGGALDAAALTPENRQTLIDVTDAASRLSGRINDIAATMMEERQRADTAVAEAVDRLNTGLAEVEGLNQSIVIARAQGSPTASLQDQRDGVIDRLSDIVPLRRLERETGEIALFSTRGAALLDGDRAILAFDQTRGVGFAQNLTTAVSIDGRPDAARLLSGGALGANLDLRDVFLPQMTQDLNGFTSDLVIRFQDADPDRGTNPGLFAVNDAVLAAPGGDQLPLELSLAPQYDPAKGGDAINLRGTLAPATDGARLLAMAAALDPGVDGLQSRAVDVSVAAISTADRSNQSLAAAQAVGLAALEAEQTATSVNTDAELQTLLAYETAYAANARVIAAVDEMLRRLLEI